MYTRWIFHDYDIGDLNDLRDAIDQDRSLLELRDDFGLTILFHAIQREDMNFVTYLITRGAKLNDFSKEKETPLCAAIKLETPQSLNLVSLLIAAGADIELAGLDGPPLHNAIKMNSLEKVIFLIDVGANVEAKKEDGETALWYAAYCGHYYIVRYLLEIGADPTTRDAITLRTPCEIVQESDFEDKELLVDVLSKSSEPKE